MAIAEPMAANVPLLLQQFFQHNVKHEASALLCCAAGQGCVLAMETLLDEYHADVNAVDGDSTPLIKAVMGGSFDAVEHVLSRSELDLNHFNQGNKALWYSTAQKDPAIAQRLLLQPGIDINTPLRAKSGKLLNTFNEAAIRNNTEVVKVILARERADPNIAAENGQTPLLCASARGCVEIVRVLLGDSRVGRVRLDDRGCSALHCAAENGDAQIVDLLLADGRIDVNARDRTGSTALHLAAKAGHVGAVNHLLMSRTIDINVQNRRGCTALWNATRQGHHQVASRLLIEDDVQVNSTGTGESTDRSTSLHHAVDEGNLALVHQLLTKSTADPNVSDEDGRTPLWWAASDGDQLLVRSLLDDPRTERHRRDNRGRAPVDAAKSGNEDEIVCLLTNCDHHCPADICAMVVLIVILIPSLLLLSLASVVGRALARVCIL